MSCDIQNESFGGASTLSPKLAWLLAAPHTWSGSIYPVLVAVAVAVARGEHISIVMVCALLVISVLMQSAVNTLNDYYDYVKGTDTKDDNVDVDDSVLVYNDINPKSVRNLAFAFIGCAFLIGIYVIVISGWIPFVIALVGVSVVYLYSGGKTPISYLPISEFMSGFIMGCLIPAASYTALTARFDPMIFVFSIPEFFGIALIMMTNNTSDIEKDISAGRKTLPSMVGRERAVAIYRLILFAWYLSIAVIVAIWFRAGLLIMPFMVLATYPILKAMLENTMTPQMRRVSMTQICNMNIALGTFYALAIMFSMAAIYML